MSIFEIFFELYKVDEKLGRDYRLRGLAPRRRLEPCRSEEKIWLFQSRKEAQGNRLIREKATITGRSCIGEIHR